jgi:hypothetical protein
MQAGATEPIPLREAPARFLTADWEKLVEIAESVPKAMAMLSNHEPGIIGFYRSGVIGAGDGLPHHHKTEQAYLLSEKMKDDFKTICAAGKLVGEGIYSGTDQRQEIPAEIWNELVIHFESNQITSKRGTYHYVMIRTAAAVEDDLRAQLVAWLTQRLSERGSESRKILVDAALEKFQGSYRVRTFNDAYGDVYGHVRGRPRRAQKMKK